MSQPSYEQQSAPIPAPAERKKTRHWLWIVPVAGVIVGISVAVLLTTGSGSGSEKGPEVFTVTGSMTASRCGSSGYSDITEGAQVEVTNDKEHILGVGKLTETGSRCKFDFRVHNVPVGEKLYGVHIGNNNRGVIWKNEQEARQGFELSLG